MKGDLEYGSDSSDGESIKAKVNRTRFWRTTTCLALCMLIVGIACSVAFCISSVRAAESDEHLRFEKDANKIAAAVETTFKEYLTVGLWVHQSMRGKANFSSFEDDRKEFKILHRYVEATGLFPTAMGYAAKIADSDRELLEGESSAYLQKEYPDYDYLGFTGMSFNRSSPHGYDLVRETEKAFYFPLILLQPLRGNEFYIDLDLFSSPSAPLMLEATKTQQVVSSTPYPSFDPTKGKHMMMLHPGTVEDDPIFESLPTNRGLASVLVSFRPFMERVAQKQQQRPIAVYIYALSNTRDEFVNFGGASCYAGSNSTISLMANPPSLEDLLANKPKHWHIREFDLQLTQSPFKVVVVDDNHVYHTSIWKGIWGGVLIFVATLMLVLWVTTHLERGRRLARMRQQAEAEKAALVCHNAHAMVQAERQRNEYLAHEVRNPLASAMAACSFLETNHQKSLATTERTNGHCDIDKELNDDIHVVSSSLAFINDLLRSMLDTSKIAGSSLVLQPSPTDLFEDVLQPVKTMIDCKDNPFEVEIQCDDDLAIDIDKMRLKQVVLNLAGNARKFVQRGFIRLTARLVEPEGKIRLAVEDSGPGIPSHKKSQVFQRFQESLDQLNQGTGMGLSLCHGLVELMGGQLYLDESYCSGASPDRPGARFIVDLPMNLLVSSYASTRSSGTRYASHESDNSTSESVDLEMGPEPAAVKKSKASTGLPSDLRVLLVDDDTILRKMLSRSIRRLAPTWTIREAANGETALSIIDGIQEQEQDGKTGEPPFDVIFMDQYMASVQKQLLGTETVQKLRARGVTARICGLSANDMKTAFQDAGADSFLLKPFKTDANEFRKDLLGVLGLNE